MKPNELKTQTDFKRAALEFYCTNLTIQQSLRRKVDIFCSHRISTEETIVAVLVYFHVLHCKRFPVTYHFMKWKGDKGSEAKHPFLFDFRANFPTGNSEYETSKNNTEMYAAQQNPLLEETIIDALCRREISPRSAAKSLALNKIEL